MELLVSGEAAEVAVSDAVEERIVGGRVFVGSCLTVSLSAANCKQKLYAGTNSSSKIYGAESKAARSSTFTAGDALE